MECEKRWLNVLVMKCLRGMTIVSRIDGIMNVVVRLKKGLVRAGKRGLEFLKYEGMYSKRLRSYLLLQFMY